MRAMKTLTVAYYALVQSLRFVGPTALIMLIF